VGDGLLVVERGLLAHVVSVPSGAMPPAGWPVLCFLHGRDEGAPCPLLEVVTRHGPLRAGSWTEARERFLVVAPQLPVSGDHWHAHADAVAALVDAVTREHGGDGARTHLTGFSFGGNGVLDLALLQPRRWAALWAVDPPRAPRERIAAPFWLSVGERTRPLLAGFVDRLALAPLAEQSPGDRVFLDEGEDHVGAAARAYADPRIYAWLLARRAGPPL